MVDYFNTALSYEFIPKVIDLLKISAIGLLIGVVLFLALAAITFILNGGLQTVFSWSAVIILIMTIISLFVVIVCIVLTPTIFCAVSIKIGLMDIFGMTELIAGLISTFFCVFILCALVELIYNEK